MTQSSGAPVAGEALSQEGALFEHWARSKGYDLTVKMNGAYQHPRTVEAQEVWLARAMFDSSRSHRSEPDQGYDFASCVTCGQPVTVNNDGSVEPWSSIKYLLDSYPGSVRVKRPLCNEELLGSLCATFIKLRDAVPTASGDARDAEFADCPYAHGVKTRTEPCRHCGSGKCLRFNSVAARGES